jgi:acetyl esterase
MAPYLDPSNQAFINAGARANGPPLQDLSYVEARQVLEELQKHSSPSDVLREEIEAPVGPTGIVKTYLYKPAGIPGDLPLIFFFHGGGWILGSPSTHDSLVRDLVRQTGCAILFPYYTPAPEAKYPHQFEEAYACVEYFVRNGSDYGLVTDNIAFAGDSVGGKLCIVNYYRRGY